MIDSLALLLLSTLGAEDVPLPRLTPRPAAVAGVSRPVIHLDGTWRFNPEPPERFFELEDAADWPGIRVPGEWVMQGFSVPPAGAAAYLTPFEIPADWFGSRLKLRCDAVYSECRVWVNGQQVGGHQGGFTPFELDITDAAVCGRNTLAFEVKAESLADTLASGSQYAAHCLGGIPRKVTVFPVPSLHLASLVPTTTFDAAYRDARLTVVLDLVNEGNEPVEDAVANLRLLAPDGAVVPLEVAELRLPPFPAGATHPQVVTLPVAAPLRWDPEHPHLYRLDCELAVAGRPAVTVSEVVGFRQVEIEGNRLLVNGRPVKLRGVNRHEVHPLCGRSLTLSEWRKDAELFRQANVNYIRTSHYPPAEEFLDACDELGLFVECEAPICWVQHGANPTWGEEGYDYRDPHLLASLVRANLENVVANHHHPSVIIWSLANESLWSDHFARVLAAVAAADPTRPTSFHDQCQGGYNNAGSTAAIANFHYPGPDGPARIDGGGRPLLFGEYCHLNAYNRHEIVTDPGVRDAWGLALEPMWERMYATEGVLGGAIWAGVDDTFFLPDGRTVGYGTWGPLDGWRRAKPEYWHVRKVYSPVRVLDAALAVPGAGAPLSVRVENRYDFTDLGETRIRWSLGSRSGAAAAAVAPHGTGEVVIHPEAAVIAGDVLELTFFDPRGFIAEQVRIPVGERPDDETPQPPVRSLRVERTEHEITVTSGAVRWRLDPRSGRILEGAFGGAPVLVGGPELMLLPLNGEGGTQMTGAETDYAPFTATCAAWSGTAVQVEETGSSFVMTVAGRYREAEGVFRIEIDGRGDLAASYEFTVTAAVVARQIGLVFDLPRGLDTLSWRRDAQWSVYPEDHIGRPVGTARAHAEGAASGPAGPSAPPDRPWALDGNGLGSNDFRATRRNVRRALLANPEGRGVELRSDGTKHVRAWISGAGVRLLAADHSDLGAERFLGSHARRFQRSLAKGDGVHGRVLLRLVGD